jgi:diguanylate cyclase (GGDEF)-like protein
VVHVDGLHEIEALAGRFASDDHLAFVARVIRAVCPEARLVFRVGRSELAFILPSITAHHAEELLQQARMALSASPRPATVLANVTLGLTFGVSELVDDTTSEELVREADHRMCECKRDSVRVNVPAVPSTWPAPALPREADLRRKM